MQETCKRVSTQRVATVAWLVTKGRSQTVSENLTLLHTNILESDFMTTKAELQKQAREIGLLAIKISNALHKRATHDPNHGILVCAADIENVEQILAQALLQARQEALEEAVKALEEAAQKTIGTNIKFTVGCGVNAIRKLKEIEG